MRDRMLILHDWGSGTDLGTEPCGRVQHCDGFWGQLVHNLFLWPDPAKHVKFLIYSVHVYQGI